MDVLHVRVVDVGRVPAEAEARPQDAARQTVPAFATTSVTSRDGVGG